jgi:hypothetical protein
VWVLSYLITFLPKSWINELGVDIDERRDISDDAALKAMTRNDTTNDENLESAGVASITRR